MQLGGFGHHIELVVDVAAQQRRVGRATALERHVRQFRARPLAEQHAHEVRQRALARCAVGALAGFGLGARDHVFHVLHRYPGAGHHAELEMRQQRDRREVGHRVVVQLLVDVREQHHRPAGQQHHGLAVGRRALDLPQRDASARTRPVLHNDRRKIVLQALGHQPRQQVRRAARRETHHDLQRRFVLRQRGQGQAGRGGQGQRAEREGTSMHGVAPGGCGGVRVFPRWNPAC